jgi:hypothetical protein
VVVPPFEFVITEGGGNQRVGRHVQHTKQGSNAGADGVHEVGSNVGSNAGADGVHEVGSNVGVQVVIDVHIIGWG